MQSPVGSGFSLYSDPLSSLSLGSPTLIPLSTLLLTWANTLNPPTHPSTTHRSIYPSTYTFTRHPSTHLDIHPPFHHPSTIRLLFYHSSIVHRLTTQLPTHLSTHPSAICLPSQTPIYSSTCPPCHLFHHPPTHPSVSITWFLWRAQMTTPLASRCPRVGLGRVWPVLSFSHHILALAATFVPLTSENQEPISAQFQVLSSGPRACSCLGLVQVLSLLGGHSHLLVVSLSSSWSPHPYSSKAKALVSNTYESLKPSC